MAIIYDTVEIEKYELKFEDGFEMIVFGDMESVLFACDKNIDEHGECTECYKVEFGNRWIPDKKTRIW